MKATMNPLDLLAEVAVTCTDDESGDKLENCDDYSKSDTESGEQLCGSESELVIKPSAITDNNNSIELSSKVDCVLASTAMEQRNSEENCGLAIKNDAGMAVDNDGSANSDERQAEASLVEPEVDKTSSKCTCPKINSPVVCGSHCTLKKSDSSSCKTPTDFIALKKGDIKHTDSEHTYPSKKPPVDGVSTPTTAAPPAESLAQRVTRLLSPNFKLTMTDTIPSVLQNRHFSSLLIGNMGSATMRTALSQGTRVFPHPVTVKPRGPVARKYPNISLSTLPIEHPLLDHDYCYQNYYELVQAATKLVKERNAKKKALAKQELKTTVSEEGQPTKRKYRTKRVIAAEAEHRALLMQRLQEGDETAQEKLDELDRLQREREMKSSKKHKKKREEAPSIEVEADSEDEVLNEFTEDVDRENPVIDHDSTFKDQFVYFGSKKYQSRSRRHNKGKDPYELFWTTGQLKSETSEAQLDSKQDQEIDDVLDILGISPRQSVDECVASPSSSADSAHDDFSNASSLVSDRCAVESIVSADGSSTNNKPVDGEQQASKTCGNPAANVSLGVGLDDLLQGITVDQVSELIQALNAEPSLDTVGIATDTESTQRALTVETMHTVPTLSTLARDCCLANAIAIPELEENQCLSQQSQTSNLSLDFPDADLLTSDKHIDLDLLEKLSATPPRPVRPTSLFSLKGDGDTLPSPSASTELTFKATSKAPMVVPVTMYWNTFPALLLDGVKYVRLIDISRQALPSKETGLLKKRAQSLGYEVITCTDLQRNLLVKYAFACPSRSNLMVNEAAAAEVIASYMEKSEIEELSKAPKLVGQSKAGVLPTATTTARKANAEPVTLMPQVLVEHEPLQHSSAGSGKKSSASGAEPTAPERSSRLRQLTSSYRRFLPRSTSIVSGGSPKETGGSNSTQEENASDRGYHSDQSPDSVHARRVSVKKNKIKERKEKQKKSVRRSLSTTDKRCASSADTSLPKLTLEERLIEVDEHTPPSPSLCSPTGVSDVSAGGISPDTANSALKHQLPSELCEPMLNVMTKSDIVHIRHMDFTPKRNSKDLYQDGDLFLEFFKSLRSPCIQCCTCRQFYTVRSFSKHQHVNRKLATVKNRQRTEPRGSSIGSAAWQIFQKKKQRLESNRSPLTKLSDTCLTKPAPVSADGRHHKLFPNSPQKLGKRIPKQKKCNPDELYYSNPCIKNTSRKRQAEADAKVDKKRVCLTAGSTSLNEHVDR